MSATIERLRQFAANLPSGEISDMKGLEELLRAAWSEFAGGGEQSMHGGKLGRMEDVRWDPPELSFTIERHGGTVLGSTRAELHRWTVDLDHHTARCAPGRYRQIYPRQARLDVKPLVEEIVALLLNQAEDPRMKRFSDDRVRVNIRELIPAEGPRETTAGHRKRFRKVLEERLAALGWRLVRGSAPYTYERNS